MAGCSVERRSANLPNEPCAIDAQGMRFRSESGKDRVVFPGSDRTVAGDAVGRRRNLIRMIAWSEPLFGVGGSWLGHLAPVPRLEAAGTAAVSPWFLTMTGR
jgi:hypothetical protein